VWVEGGAPSVQASSAIVVRLRALDVDALPIDQTHAEVEFRFGNRTVPVNWNRGSNEYVASVPRPSLTPPGPGPYDTEPSSSTPDGLPQHRDLTSASKLSRHCGHCRILWALEKLIGAFISKCNRLLRYEPLDLPQTSLDYGDSSPPQGAPLQHIQVQHLTHLRCAVADLISGARRAPAGPTASTAHSDLAASG
jgi:hypothetical protein